MAFDTPLDVLKQRRASHDPNDPLLHLSQLKAFMDGSLGSRTAALAAPYTDDPANSGLPRYDQAKLNQMAAERAAARFQLGFHAIGDKANELALRAMDGGIFLRALGKCYDAHTGPFPRTPPLPCERKVIASARFRIEHAQVVLPDAFNRFHDLGIIASMQPSHLLTDMAWAEQRLGPERVKYAYAWKSFLDHNVTLAFGTDYPVESIDPMRGLYAAITRQNEAGTQTFQPQERLTLNQALYAYTQASAFAEFREHTKGRLEPGFLADLVVLDRDLTTSTPRQILHAKVLRTVVGGRTVYLAPEPGQ
jgi:predicted amidohydrolase YtcJ